MSSDRRFSLLWGIGRGYNRGRLERDSPMSEPPTDNTVKLRCPACGLDGRAVGGPRAKVVRCPACHQPITVPAFKGKPGMIARLTYSLPRPAVMRSRLTSRARQPDAERPSESHERKLLIGIGFLAVALAAALVGVMVGR